VIRSSFTREPRAGDVIRGDVRIPEGRPPRSAIVVVHGFKGFKDWGFFPHTCDRLAAAGHAVVSFNMSHSGIGSSPLDFTELDQFGRNTLSLELDDVRAVVDEVLTGELLPRRPRSVAVLGHSRGGGQTVLAAAEDERIAAIATWAAVSHFDRWTDETKDEWRDAGRIWVMNARTGQQMPLDVGLLEDFEAHSDRLDIPAAAGRVSAPWLIVHGRNDLTVGVAEAHELAEAAQKGRLMLVDGAGHTFEARHPFEESTPQLDRALEATIAHFAQLLAD
jgi:dienelactone hydrolase